MNKVDIDLSARIIYISSDIDYNTYTINKLIVGVAVDKSFSSKLYNLFDSDDDVMDYLVKSGLVLIQQESSEFDILEFSTTSEIYRVLMILNIKLCDNMIIISPNTNR